VVKLYPANNFRGAAPSVPVPGAEAVMDAIVINVLYAFQEHHRGRKASAPSFVDTFALYSLQLLVVLLRAARCYWL
jgi:hypothetical protein